MKFSKLKILVLFVICLMMISLLSAKMVEGEVEASKSLDLQHWHNVGNIWLRVSNYGFFGHGSGANPEWPSLEYPGGSGVDYLYQGALWFGAKKERKNADGKLLYWLEFPPVAGTAPSDYVLITDEDERWLPSMRAVVDTLVTVGFDGDKSLYEFLPAWYTKEMNTPGYSMNSPTDVVVTQSTRSQRRTNDDDGDGLIDEDPVGRTFPFRKIGAGYPTEPRSHPYALPFVFSQFSGKFIKEEGAAGTAVIMENERIWYPLGFYDLSYDDPSTMFNFTASFDDDGDGLIDEDGAPVSEQDYISYYYDYSPFGTAGQRSYGSSAGSSTHIPLKVRVRQMSYQWSYDYIKNLVYVEFNITNMNKDEILYDCVMGIYMDCDIGPQAFGGSVIAKDDKSGYVAGKGFEFAYSRDGSGDGLAPGFIGARVCTPDPDSLQFACWFWKVGDGPLDSHPQQFSPPYQNKKTANEKYWMLSGVNPAEYQSLKELAELNETKWFEQDRAEDTRFLFGFYGKNENRGPEQINGYNNPERDDVWNLKPYETMKIVIAIFPGDDIEELKESAMWATEIYSKPQQLTTVILPDTFPHYEPPEPPQFPRMFAELREKSPNRISLDLFWENRSEFSMDNMIIPKGTDGWSTNPSYAGYDSDPMVANFGELYNSMSEIPEQFRMTETNTLPNATINPYTSFRLQHDFQGYIIWGRSGRGDRDGWISLDRWDKKDTTQDDLDYEVNQHVTNYPTMGGDTGYRTGLPDETIIQDEHISEGGIFDGYYMQDIDYTLISIKDRYLRDRTVSVYGKPLYKIIDFQSAKEDPRFTEQFIVDGEVVNYLTDYQKDQNRLIYMHPDLYDLYPGDKLKAEQLYLELVDDIVMPFRGHLGQNKVIDYDNSVEGDVIWQDRYSRRYYRYEINNLPKGHEYYVSVSAFDRGMPSKNLGPLESGKDANLRVFFPGPLAKKKMDNIYVVPNPYRGKSAFDGVITGDTIGDKGRRLWFVNLPERCNVQIFTLAGDLVDEFEHYTTNGRNYDGEGNLVDEFDLKTSGLPYNIHDVITASKESGKAKAASGIHPWKMLSKNNQVVASGLYFYSVKCRDTGDVKVGKFAIIR
ncbi:MAG: hypothetical protein FWG20_01155 [Candidatus Cloacimonetes bacterium]|nr:hypothetical protein [Candidatus Cloacimonadota bacterium]